MEYDFTLRNKVAEAKAEYEKEHGMPNYLWDSEGVVWALLDYHSSKGSVLDFTEDDWQCCKENDFTLYEVLEFCDEGYLYHTQLSDYITAVLEDWRGRNAIEEVLDVDISKNRIMDAVEDFYTWNRDKFPMVQKIYG